MIPGSSLKGKMRSLLAKEFNEAIVEPDNDHERLTRLFGSAKKGNVKRSRVLFSDMVLDNEQELRDAVLQRSNLRILLTVRQRLPIQDRLSAWLEVLFSDLI